MGAGDWIILALLALWLFTAIRWMCKKKKAGHCTGCNGCMGAHCRECRKK